MTGIRPKLMMMTDAHCTQIRRSSHPLNALHHNSKNITLMAFKCKLKCYSYKLCKRLGISTCYESLWFTNPFTLNILIKMKWCSGAAHLDVISFPHQGIGMILIFIISFIYTWWFIRWIECTRWWKNYYPVNKLRVFFSKIIRGESRGL